MDFKDPDIDVQTKIDFIENSDNPQECLENLLGEYQFCPFFALEEVLTLLCISPKMNSSQKYNILTVFYECNEDKKAVEELMRTYIPENSLFEFQIIVWLFNLGGDQYLPRLYKYIMNEQVKETIKYSNILFLKEQFPAYTLSGVKCFYVQQFVSPRYKILSAQYILEKGTGKDLVDKSKYIRDLLTIAANKDMEYNTRADAADAANHYGDAKEQDEALVILKELGGKARSMYENKQNVHYVDISDSLILLQMYEPEEKYSEISKKLKEMSDEGDSGAENIAVSASLGRILLDVAKYGTEQRWNSEEIMERVWAFIQHSDHREELERRLIQELQEMTETCSSGHAIRLVNVLTGFGGLNKITFEDQIVGEFSGRMLARLRSLANAADIMADMANKDVDAIKFYSTVDIDIKLRPKENLYIKHFREELPAVILDLQTENVPEFMTQENFDTYLQKAIGMFQGDLQE